MLSLGQSYSCLLRWDEKWGELAAGETPHLAAETEMARGLCPDSDRRRRQTGDPQLKPHGGLRALAPPGLVVVRTTASPQAGRSSRVTVLVSALPASPLPPETTRARGPGAKGHPGRAQALGIASRAVLEALVRLPARRNRIHTREMSITPPKSCRGETPGDSNLSIGRVKAIIFYLHRMAESLVVSGSGK